MNQYKAEPVSLKVPTVLVAPLDWGLGHTTRCIPLIQSLLNNGCNVCLAGNSRQITLLKAAFPTLSTVELQGYEVRLGSARLTLLLKLLIQLPRLKRIISFENKWLDKIIKKNRIDAVISDNRYGLYSSSVYSVFITHQLLIKTPFGNWADRLVQKINYSYINKFNECWVADDLYQPLAGSLSHPEILPAVPVYYSGILSRLKKIPVTDNEDFILIILSGPEPQRSILEKKLISNLKSYKGSVIFLRGLPGEPAVLPPFNRVTFYNHLPLPELNLLFQKAKFIISRCGYSTIMDIIRVGKKSILIPTPGQTEQEYLAGYLLKNKWAFCISQNKFSFITAIKEAEKFSYTYYKPTENQLKKLIDLFIVKLKP